ncbi:MAG TPA: trehalase family glycosidase, partial [Armatimonadota bacterium]|nr:trehalase family glycosidase [Armatimonadota bacterium]
APGEKKKLVLILAFTPNGSDQITAVYNGARPYEKLLQKTADHYRNVLLTADVMTPDDVLNQGTQWCKANMLRVLADYPTGRAFTNDPGKSSKVVARDSAWFVYGADYILPETSCCLMEAFASRQQDSGKIIEYYDALSDEREDYGLNINDDTPLFILAAVHHCDITGHTQCRKRLYPAVCKAADYIISQEDKRGLVYCTADGVGVYGIVGWRNIIPDMSISGAVTEVNAESYAALRAAARLAGKVGDSQKADYYHSKADALRAAIQKHLRNPENGMYYLNIDIHGNPGTEVTADELFPMIFGVADEDSMRLIRLRLSNSDFMTDAGLRTVSSLSPFFTPDTFSGLRGGVWPGVTWWYAMASTEADPGLMVDSLKRSYQQYTVHPPAHNTVPGQFSEWFDGLSLVNRGMRLSPWEPPRFLWAIIEGGIGLDITGDDVWIRPRIPYD